MDARLTFAEKLGHGLEKGISSATRRVKEIILIYVFITVTGVVLLYMNPEQQELQLATRGWGGFNEQPLTQKCYRQERTAMILSLLFGTLGVDQFYARHWPLAVFKLLTLGGFGLWSFIDVILWMVGGVYGTPGCPGGSSKGWQY
ncbi:TM2 domain-containing protein almondex [Fusarium oxysporum f. sp. rapae]|uniref:TM2 domain-containing protein almondex n=1 Tax=Fusarium oxysporum f. sp. rapae TaxID=485398 RepID=A0A8J5TWZ8_FUSOX|nr:TM2 domain-containing protein almondex [Fusarium oxysporum f. sp. rapae]